ncbi:MAG: hypothetical protein ABI411_19050 [Tahibacter sp.]
MSRSWWMIGALALSVVANAQTLEELTKRAEQGDPESQVDLAYKFLIGDGVPKSEIDALSWFRRAVGQHDSSAEVALGMAYEHAALRDQSLADESGAAIGTYPDKALDWYRQAAEQGNRDGQFHFAQMLARGNRGAEALPWYRRAAEQGLKGAQRTLAMQYAEGVAVPRDRAESLHWNQRLAEQGDAEAQYQVGRSHALGLGTGKDSAVADRWYHLSANQDHLGARAALNRETPDSDTFCDFHSVTPTSWPIVNRSVVRFAFPGAKTCASTTGRIGKPPTCRVQGIDLTASYVTDAKPAERGDAQLLLLNGAPAYVANDPDKGGAGRVAIDWIPAGKSNSAVSMTIRYASLAARKIACTIVASAIRTESLADLDVLRVEPNGKHPSAWLRSVDGKERRVYKDQEATIDRGTIESIGERDITLIELLPNGYGGWMEKEVVLPVPKPNL